MREKELDDERTTARIVVPPLDKILVSENAALTAQTDEVRLIADSKVNILNNSDGADNASVVATRSVEDNDVAALQVPVIGATDVRLPNRVSMW